jgi:hypothetical protein
VRFVGNSQGTSLVETMFAVMISLIAIVTLGSAIIQATVANKNQGNEMTRATVYAQDKTEHLLSLNFFNCTKSNSLQPSGCSTTGLAASGWTQGLLSGGSLGPLQFDCPASGSTVGYVDYLDVAGSQMTGTACTTLASPSGATLPAYVRQWQVQDIIPSTGPALKQVTVAVYALNGINAGGGKPIVVLTSLLSN